MRSNLDINAYSMRLYLKIISSFGVTLLLVITSLSISACSVVSSYVCGDSEWEKNRELWQTSKVANYNFIVTRFVGGTYMYAPMLIKVRDCKAVSLEPTEELLPLIKTDGYEEYDTVEKMFTRIQRFCLNGDKVTVLYNKEFGYPEDIRIFPSGGGVDSGYRIEVKKFEKIIPN